MENEILYSRNARPCVSTIQIAQKSNFATDHAVPKISHH
jgi:hypothetical protein